MCVNAYQGEGAWQTREDKSKWKNIFPSLMCDEPIAQAEAAALSLDRGYLVP